MQNNNTPVIAIVSKKQNMVAVSEETKQFISDEAASFSALNKGGDIQNASQREIADSMVDFITANRYQMVEKPVMVEETNDEGESIFIDSGETEPFEVDAFEEMVNGQMAKRLTNVRQGSGSAKIKTLEETIAALKAELAAKG